MSYLPSTNIIPSSISAHPKSHLRRCEEVLPEVTSPEVSLTGNDVTGSNMTGIGSHVTGSDRAFSYYSSSTKCTIVHVRHGYRMWRDRSSRDPFGVPLEGWGARMRNRKLHNFHPIGVYSSEVITFGVPFEGWDARMRNRKLRNIRSNVTRRTSPGKYGSARICSLCYVVLQGYFLSRPRSHCGISTK